MLAYAHVAVTYGTLHLTLAVLIAPMLLLRTDESVRFALYYSKSLQDNVLRERSSNPSYIRQTFACLPALAVC